MRYAQVDWYQVGRVVFALLLVGLCQHVPAEHVYVCRVVRAFQGVVGHDGSRPIFGNAQLLIHKVFHCTSFGLFRELRVHRRLVQLKGLFLFVLIYEILPCLLEEVLLLVLVAHEVFFL